MYLQFALMRPSPYQDVSEARRWTPDRRTQSIVAMNSWVSGRSPLGIGPWAIQEPARRPLLYGRPSVRDRRPADLAPNARA